VSASKRNGNQRRNGENKEKRNGAGVKKEIINGGGKYSAWRNGVIISGVSAKRK
jgi:hypothetical protein